MSKLNELLKELRDEIGGDLIQMFVIGSDGMAIAAESILTDSEVIEQGAVRSMMSMQAANRISEKLKLGDYQETIITTDKIYVIVNFLGDGSYGLSVSVYRKAILGTIRMLVNEYSPKIWDAIPR